MKRWLHAILCSLGLFIGLSLLAVYIAILLTIWLTKG